MLKLNLSSWLYNWLAAFFTNPSPRAPFDHIWAIVRRVSRVTLGADVWKDVLRRAVNQSCWLELTWSMYHGRSVKRLNLEIKRIEIALSSTTWSITWPSIFGEGHICWVPDQWKERKATPGHVFVSDSSVSVGLNSVLKLYLKRRLDCDAGNVVSCTPLYVCMFVYFGDFGRSKYTIILS